MAPDDQRHGTAAGYQAHRRAGQPTCTPCREAHRDYIRQYRASRPALVDVERAKSRARSRALWRLAAMRPVLFRALFAEEMAKEEATLEVAA